jgi:adenylate cyclase
MGISKLALNAVTEQALTTRGSHRSANALRLDLFGGFQAFCSAEGRRVGVAIPGVRQKALLSYLALQPTFRDTRERLATLFWGDRDEQQARQSLRQCLLRLKRSLDAAGIDALVIGRDEIWLDGRRVSTDTMDLLAVASGSDVAAISEQTRLYRGRLLEGLDIPAENFSVWLADERTRQDRILAEALMRVISLHASKNEGALAVANAERLAAIDPLDEPFQRELLTMLARFEGRNAALRFAAALVKRIRQELNCDPDAETASLIAQIESAAPIASPSVAAPPLGDERTSVAVVGFQDLSHESAGTSLSEGFAEDLATALGRLRGLAVVGRTIVRSNKRNATDILKTGRDLRVRYVLEGSVRQIGSRLRVNVFLMDVDTSTQAWTCRYDRELGDLFGVQDEIIEHVVAAVEPRLLALEGARMARGSPERAGSWSVVANAIGLIHRFERSPNERARQLLHDLLQRERGHARAQAVMAWALLWAGHCFWPTGDEDVVGTALDHAQSATARDPNEPWVHMVRGFALSTAGEHLGAETSLKLTLSLNPSFSLARMLYGWALIRAGKTDAAIVETGKALALANGDMMVSTYQGIHGLALVAARRFDEALPVLRAAVAANIEYVGHHNTLISCCGHLGLVDEAQRLLDVRHRSLGRPMVLAEMAEPLSRFAHRHIFLKGLERAGVT